MILDQSALSFLLALVSLAVSMYVARKKAGVDELALLRGQVQSLREELLECRQECVDFRKDIMRLTDENINLLRRVVGGERHEPP